MATTTMGPAAWALLAAGGTLGTLARFALGGWLSQAAITRGWPVLLGLPLATWTINVLGCFVIGLVAALAVGTPPRLAPEARLFLAVGFCGAFTTFSTFGLETVTLLEQGHYHHALSYVVASNALGLLAVGLGLAAGRAIVPS